MLTCSGPDEASIIANYYPLVQTYLRQQQCQGVEQDALQMQPQEQHAPAIPLQAMLMSQQAEFKLNFAYSLCLQVAD